ncbi:MAG: hypothetical protein INF43_02985 [Alphaproteobacteria bacterium]|nr:hypothetical protein [Alphaproteobacteria bacterium]
MSQHLPLLGVLAALGSGVAFALYQMVVKQLHVLQPAAPGLAGMLAIPRWLGLLFPVWLAALLACWQTGALEFNLTPHALRWPLAWAACTVATTTGLVWLLKSFSLAEVAGYKKALITLGALLADVALFGFHFPLFTLLAIALLLGGAVGLSQARNRLPSVTEWAVIGVWCAVLVLQITLYKYGQQQQPQVLAHTLLAQTFATAFYAGLWAWAPVRQQPLPPRPWVLALWAAFLAGTVLEGFAYAGLPLALVLVVTMLPAALLAAHDLWRGDLPRQPRTWLALASLALGFLLLVR